MSEAQAVVGRSACRAGLQARGTACKDTVHTSSLPGGDSSSCTSATPCASSMFNTAALQAPATLNSCALGRPSTSAMRAVVVQVVAREVGEERHVDACVPARRCSTRPMDEASSAQAAQAQRRRSCLKGRVQRSSGSGVVMTGVGDLACAIPVDDGGSPTPKRADDTAAPAQARHSACAVHQAVRGLAIGAGGGDHVQHARWVVRNEGVWQCTPVACLQARHLRRRARVVEGDRPRRLRLRPGRRLAPASSAGLHDSCRPSDRVAGPGDERIVTAAAPRRLSVMSAGAPFDWPPTRSGQRSVGGCGGAGQGRRHQKLSCSATTGTWRVTICAFTSRSGCHVHHAQRLLHDFAEHRRGHVATEIPLAVAVGVVDHHRHDDARRC